VAYLTRKAVVHRQITYEICEYLIENRKRAVLPQPVVLLRS
jgi:hypothetical protein